MQTIAEILSKELNETLPHVQNVIELLDGGNTVLFIARYRKEMHGSMDDQQIRRLADRLTYLRNLDARRSEIKQSIASQEKLTDELSSKLDSAATLAELEDLYRPYKPKRTTRASIAKEKGLMPLAAKLLMQEPAADPVKLAEKYVNPGKSVNTAEEALAVAGQIISHSGHLHAPLAEAYHVAIYGYYGGDLSSRSHYWVAALHCTVIAKADRIRDYRIALQGCVLIVKYGALFFISRKRPCFDVGIFTYLPLVWLECSFRLCKKILRKELIDDRPYAVAVFYKGVYIPITESYRFYCFI